MSRVVHINAENHKDALAKGAKMFNVSISQFKQNALIKKSGKNSFQITYSNSEIENAIPDTDSLFDKLENELSDIETNEIISGMTPEEMHEKGFIGENKIDRPRPKIQEKQVEKGYTFSEGVDYYSCTLYNNIKNLPYEDIEHIDDTLPNQIVASKISKVVYTKKEDFKSTLFHDKKYLESCNLKVSYQNKNVIYTSLKRGKLVLLRDLIYLVPSDRDSYFNIRVAPNKMLVEADFYPSKGNGRSLSFGFIRSELLAKKILFGLKVDVIKENIKIAEESGECLNNIIIAEGKEPVDGIDAEVTLNFSQESVIDDFKILPDGRVDYRKQARIQVVKKGELLAYITEPEKGIEGKDVFGNTIEAKDGDIRVLYAGTNVEKSRSGLEFYAASDGQPVLNKNILNVFPHYHVPGDVDYSTGNIEFEGNVTIKGNVLPGFEVKATGDILVMGNIDNGIIDA
ncbi:MAG: FapA family protein, partial [Chitinispirillia bacterium]